MTERYRVKKDHGSMKAWDILKRVGETEDYSCEKVIDGIKYKFSFSEKYIKDRLDVFEDIDKEWAKDSRWFLNDKK